jgi:hypothetical protein
MSDTIRSVGSEWLSAQLLGRRPTVDPGDRLSELEATRDTLERDSAVVEAEIAKLQVERLEEEREQRAEISAAFSSGVRRPVPPPPPSQAQRMNAMFLRAFGRIP